MGAKKRQVWVEKRLDQLCKDYDDVDSEIRRIVTNSEELEACSELLKTINQRMRSLATVSKLSVVKGNDKDIDELPFANKWGSTE